MERTWVGLGGTVPQERVVADSGGAGTSRPPAGIHAVLRRDGDEGSATWTRIHPAAKGRSSKGRDTTGPRVGLFRVELRAADETVGSLWSQRDDSAGQPHLEETRLLAAAADQIGQAVRRERLMAQAAELEIARRSDELRPAARDPVGRIAEASRERRATQVLMSRDVGDTRAGIMRRSVADDVANALPQVELHLIGGGEGREPVPTR